MYNPPLPPKLHYNNGFDQAACKRSIWKPLLTARPIRVTCGACKRTREYREMMSEYRI